MLRFFVYFFFFDPHNHIKYSTYKNHPFIDEETQGYGGEGIFPKLFNKSEASEDANPGL